MSSSLRAPEGWGGRRVAILHAGSNVPVFGDFPSRLSEAMGLPLTEEDEGLDLAYLLAWEETSAPRCPCFIPFETIVRAGDKRTQARLFREAAVPTPETLLCDSIEEAQALLASRPDKQWALKWPVGCGALGHRLLTPQTEITALWRPPLLVQEFIALPDPGVHRLYSVANEPALWLVRSYPTGHALLAVGSREHGAVPSLLGEPPAAAVRAAMAAMRAVGVADSFGCADLLRTPDGRWLVLEVNTDGVYQFIPREIGLPAYTAKLNELLRRALRRRSREAHVGAA